MKRSNDHSSGRESAEPSGTPRMGSVTSASLLDRVRGGEQRAWSRLTRQQAEMNHVLRQALELVRADFEPATWQAFWQTVVDGRQTQDVAAELNMSPNAVRIARSRVRGRLRQEFDKLID